MDVGLGTAKHYRDTTGWKPGDLEHYLVPEHVYSEQENEVWRALYKRQLGVLPGRAVSWFMDSLSTLGIAPDRVPKLDEVNAILKKRSGWQAVPVPGLIPGEPFFEMLANRRFPVGNFIRTPDQMDYIQEPDIFHDMFGHIPILADPVFGDYMEAYGRGGMKAAKLGALDMLGHVYWYTVEFGLIREKGQVKIYGAGILSSPAESVFSVESPSPNRVAFNLERMLRTHHFIDDFQDTYFVIDSFEQMFEATKPDFTPIYERVKKLPVLMPHELAEGDDVITRGTNEYSVGARARRAERLRQNPDTMTTY